ncbi:invasion associated locus B family protein [Parasulfitobacter algicola]|uniref:Invasion associated locus B family protein n=1 Tax=Parasulfitobacter algicola TaxID=2614809 RepID=A0ABX2IR48_9RHOB|nr:invasion associated locus B family protein [Sulfitobacter algicola]NSX55352.1 invasion associated locus B family protein [Sulfitobacter algicola]
MSDILKTFCAVTLVGLAAPVFAQDTTNEAEPPAQEEAAPTEAPQLEMGEDVTNEIRPGQRFIREEFSDWKIRCTRLPDGRDGCEMHQLLMDSEDNPVAELNILPLAEDQRPARAAVNFLAPLDTLLTEQVTLTIDSGTARRYPFRQCAEIGCLAQFGVDENYVNNFKRGGQARIRIVPALAPDQNVVLTVSLNGFTAAFDALDQANEEDPQPATIPE